MKHMIKKFTPFMPADQISICNAQNTCIEARGENARIIVLGIFFVLLAVAANYAGRE
jgi:hypothetical protein